MRILICGAGVAGLSLAGCLGRQGHHVLVVERSPRLREGGYMIDFFGPGFDVAERLGLLPRLAAIHDPVDRLIFADAAGHARVSVQYDVLRRRLFRDRHFNFLRADLEGVLFDALPSRRVVQFGLTVVAVEQDSDGVRATLSDGRVVETDLLVGADGVHSWIRGLAFGGESRFVRDLGYVAAAFVISEPPEAFGIGKDVVTLTAPGIRSRSTLFRGHEWPPSSSETRTAASTPLPPRRRGRNWILTIETSGGSYRTYSELRSQPARSISMR